VQYHAGVGNLKDELLKAKLLSQKEGKRIAHEQRLERHAKGREAIEEEAQRRQDELRALREDQKRRTQEAQARLDAERKRAARHAELVELVRSHALRHVSGPRRFHFVTRQGALPFFAVDQDTCRRIEGGMLCIVEDLGARVESFALVDRPTAQRVLEFDRDAVRFMAGERR
jgi:uncharacterized protein YaiL (DUF2058 family)